MDQQKIVKITVMLFVVSLAYFVIDMAVNGYQKFLRGGEKVVWASDANVANMPSDAQLRKYMSQLIEDTLRFSNVTYSRRC